ncbi:MAG TPA: hypothetical protein VK166_00595 [Chitinophagaceae bacterium]|nr:hypothetical protein [Chitinophagaceae bacterium]
MKKIISLLCVSAFFSASLYSQKTFRDTLDIKYTFSCPDNYDIFRQPDGSVQVVSPLSGADDKYREGIAFNVSKAFYGMSLDSLASFMKVRMTQSYKSNIGPLDVRVEPIRIGGIEGRRVSMTAIINGATMSTSESFVMRKGGMLRISYMNEYQSKSNEMPSFQKVLESVKID